MPTPSEAPAANAASDAPLGFDSPPGPTPEERLAFMFDAFPTPWREEIDEDGGVMMKASNDRPIAYFGDMETTDSADHTALDLCANAPAMLAALGAIDRVRKGLTEAIVNAEMRAAREPAPVERVILLNLIKPLREVLSQLEEVLPLPSPPPLPFRPPCPAPPRRRTDERNRPLRFRPRREAHGRPQPRRRPH